MVIKKYLHSCILIEEGGKRLLIDPGSLSFIEGKIEPKDIGQVDVVIFTHKHQDHYYPEVLKDFMGTDTKIVSSAEIAVLLKQDGFSAEIASEGEELDIAGFKIKPLRAPHERIPTEIPHNFAYLINNSFLHTGDSLSVFGAGYAKVLALPVAGPWNKLSEALDFAIKLKPRIVIPIHDAIIKDFFLDRIYNYMCKPVLAKEGIEFKPLALGEEIEVQ
ncbi:MAG: hypothetical protein A3B23_01065 [Candidatus Colwellbacteria bacterium RIFCSPLOWO2_01_FULL_48_10]|uniref:Metallo-beta-lactamase domain-containing protein n=1 Tax=Candidatus Colwellbacteria bacterium RIFCSPLOWO2_01_FULL_48_10 TaxID=1797690 RepID=A0A1G1Z4H4_9BACT|nr:MAG: hypothetical protein A3B23_01065 [Candidatus Colwellbacteria bacterium RIFCSPLOWO2_01_FULL_48_10]